MNSPTKDGGGDNTNCEAGAKRTAERAKLQSCQEKGSPSDHSATTNENDASKADSNQQSNQSNKSNQTLNHSNESKGDTNTPSPQNTVARKVGKRKSQPKLRANAKRQKNRRRNGKRENYKDDPHYYERVNHLNNKAEKGEVITVDEMKEVFRSHLRVGTISFIAKQGDSKKDNGETLCLLETDCIRARDIKRKYAKDYREENKVKINNANRQYRERKKKRQQCNQETTTRKKSKVNQKPAVTSPNPSLDQDDNAVFQTDENLRVTDEVGNVNESTPEPSDVARVNNATDTKVLQENTEVSKAVGNAKQSPGQPQVSNSPKEPRITADGNKTSSDDVVIGDPSNPKPAVTSPNPILDQDDNAVLQADEALHVTDDVGNVNESTPEPSDVACKNNAVDTTVTQNVDDEVEIVGVKQGYGQNKETKQKTDSSATSKVLQESKQKSVQPKAQKCPPSGVPAVVTLPVSLPKGNNSDTSSAESLLPLPRPDIYHQGGMRNVTAQQNRDKAKVQQRMADDLKRKEAEKDEKERKEYMIKDLDRTARGVCMAYRGDHDHKMFEFQSLHKLDEYTQDNIRVDELFTFGVFLSQGRKDFLARANKDYLTETMDDRANIYKSFEVQDYTFDDNHPEKLYNFE